MRFCRDVTAHRLAATQEPARSDAELEECVRVVSHELREPLHNVTIYLRLLANEYQGKLAADADDYIRYALDGASWMQTLIDGLLAYSRVTTERRAIEPTDFGSVVAKAIANLAAAIEEQGATVTCEPMPTVRVDARAMTEVFQNLIENALKFRARKPPSVHVKAQRRQDRWLFSVRDNGIGVDPAHAERVFTIFQRLHSRGEYPGTGIGLAICKKIVERHGGRIWMESTPGGGSTFYLTIPTAERPSSFSLDEVLRTAVLRTLDETGGNRRHAAQLLGVSRSTVHRMLARWGLRSTVSVPVSSSASSALSSLATRTARSSTTPPPPRHSGRGFR